MMSRRNLWLTIGILLLVLVATSCAGRSRSSAELLEVPACSLGEEDLAKRKQLLKTMTKGIQERRELENGIAYRFEPGAGIVTRLAQLVDLERECCSFFGFQIKVAEDNGPVWLELTGPKDIIEEYFGGE